MKAVQRLTKLLTVPLIGTHIRPCRSSTQTNYLYTRHRKACAAYQNRDVHTHICTQENFIEYSRILMGYASPHTVLVRKYMDPPLYTYSSRYNMHLTMCPQRYEKSN